MVRPKIIWSDLALICRMVGASDRDKSPTGRKCGMRILTHQVTHQVEASPKGGLAQPLKINSQNMTVHDPSVCVASVVFQVHS